MARRRKRRSKRAERSYLYDDGSYHRNPEEGVSYYGYDASYGGSREHMRMDQTSFNTSFTTPSYNYTAPSAPSTPSYDYNTPSAPTPTPSYSNNSESYSEPSHSYNSSYTYQVALQLSLPFVNTTSLVPAGTLAGTSNDPENDPLLSVLKVPFPEESCEKPLASDAELLNEYSYYGKEGILKLDPSEDSWVNTSTN